LCDVGFNLDLVRNTCCPSTCLSCTELFGAYTCLTCKFGLTVNTYK
jgi:hypothetical protein